MLFLLLCPALRAEVEPVLRGYVTDAGTPARFEVDGRVVVCTSGKTVTSRHVGKQLLGNDVCTTRFVGEELTVRGSVQRKPERIEADSLVIEEPKEIAVQGSAISDAVLRKEPREVVVRADGYRLQLTPETKVNYEASLAPGLQVLATNQWIAYRGTLQPDGTVRVQQASVGPNVISDAEDKLRSKTDFDAAAVTEDDRQSALGRLVAGVDRSRLPAVDDPELQARMERIGEELIPAYQKALPKGDPSKIQFRFQLVDESKYAYFPLPSGVVLVAHEAALKLTDDSQMAALLATAIAGVLQKQELRTRAVRKEGTVTDIAGGIGGLLVPGLGIATVIANREVADRVDEHVMQANAREALWLMHDAGFDVHQAPVVFWRFQAKPNDSLGHTRPSAHVQYLYQLLGTVWKQVPHPEGERSEDLPAGETSRNQPPPPSGLH